MRANFAHDPERNFWAKVSKTDSCWLWSGGTDSRGYGSFWNGERLVGAHRYSYELANGVLSDSVEVDHRRTCPKNCVRPDHLRPTTRKQNLENRSGAQVNNRTSGLRGVTWDKARKKWVAQAHHHGKHIFFGRYDTIEAAEQAAIEGRNRLFTHNDADRESA